MDFRKDIELTSVPNKAIVKIACDSKYWLWVNGVLAVFEGQLKRGPNPNDTYYDEVDIASFLLKGENSIAVLVWYFGKDGFSHNSSGAAGLAFECDAINLISDASWSGKLDKGFDFTGRPIPNSRLPESNVKFNAQFGNFEWIKPKAEIKKFNGSGFVNGFNEVKVIGEAESAPWNNLVLRPIPHWKNSGIREYENANEIPAEGTGEWIECKLPYNCHITPLLDVEAPAGVTINMETDNSRTDYKGWWDGASLRAEYVTKDGAQQYESLGWMNGHVMKYLIPKGVKINSLTYRETGFNTEITGWFRTNDKFYERLWEKAARTLYVNMRDTYMDCPGRERAQWWGDVVIQSGEAFYVLSPSAATLAEKGILELINWQREDGTIYSPIPGGSWNMELPGQMLASIGYYGFWNYYQNTGDKETLAKVYTGVKRYLDVWKLKADGTLVERTGDWPWGGHGAKIDKQLLFNAWYYLALKGYYNMSELLGETAEAKQTLKAMAKFKTAFNSVFWDEKGYRTAKYEGEYDDRAQALAVVSGLAGKDKYDELLDIFKTSYLASPYMEKYVLEALFVMEETDFALERMKKRFYKMVDVSPWTTLYEHFSTGNEAGRGSYNHAWSGGGLTLLAQYVCGLEPIEAAWKTFKVKPQLGSLEFAETGNETVAGKVAVKLTKVEKGMDIKLTVPEGSEAVVYIPAKNKKVTIDGEKTTSKEKDGDYSLYRLSGGEYKISAR
jgi:alpha-L-rhamnosidase